jgi:hypothetical protein
MGMSIHWDNEDKSVVRYGFVKSWTWNDLYTVLDQSERLVSSRSVDIVIDLRAANPLPANYMQDLNAMQHAKVFSRRIDALPATVIFLGTNAFLRAMYNTFHGAFGTQSENVHFLADAKQVDSILARRRALV